MLSQIRKSDTIEDYKKGGKIKQNRDKVTSNSKGMKQKQKQVVNIKNVINIEKKNRRKSAKTKSKPAPSPSPAPAPALAPSYSTFNRFFQPSDQNYKSISMGNNIPNADNINAISNRVSNLILGRIQNNVNNANSNFVLPDNFNNLSDLAIANDSSPKPEMKEREEKIQDSEVNIKLVGEYDVDVLLPEQEAMGRNYIQPLKSESDRLAEGILEEEYEEDIAAAPEAATRGDDLSRLNKLSRPQLEQLGKENKIQLTMSSGKKKLTKPEIIDALLIKKWGVIKLGDYTSFKSSP
jgi:hypothetical protein